MVRLVQTINAFEINVDSFSLKKKNDYSSKLTHIFQKIRQSEFVKWVKRYEPLNIAGKVLSVLNYFQKSLNNLFAFNAKNAANKASGIFRSIIVKSAFYNVIMRYAKIAAITIAPYHLYRVVKHTRDLIRGDTSLKIDSIFKIIVSSASLLDGITAFCKNLADIAVISIQAVQWVPFVNIFSSVLTSFSIVVHARDYMKFKRFIKQVQSGLDIKKMKTDVNIAKDYAKRILNSPKPDLKGIFQIDTLYLKEKLGKIYSNAIGKNKSVQSEQMLLNVVKKIHALSTTRRSCKILKALAVVVNIIGLLTLLTGAVIPLGFAIIGVAGSMHVIAYVLEKFRYRRLDSCLKKV